MTTSFDTPPTRLSLGSSRSGSRRQSLLSNDSAMHLSDTYGHSWTPNTALSQWRQTYVAGTTSDSSIQSTSLALPDESRFTTCMALSSDQPLIAVGSGSYETNMFFVQTVDGQLDVRASFASKFPIYSLAFHAGLLMAGTDRNTSVLYKVDRARLLGFADSEADRFAGAFGASDSKDGPLVRCVGTYKNKAAKSIDIAAPGNHVPTRRVARVAFSQSSAWLPDGVAAESPVFLSCLGGVVNVWDATRNQHPLRVERLSPQPLSAASWCPHAPASLIAASGVDGVVSVIDLRKRSKPVVWRAGTKHESLGGVVSGSAWLTGQRSSGGDGWCANDVSWSPFVPYWLASAGDNGQINLWDIRFAARDGSPAAVARHPTNYGSVRSVVWSPTHSDVVSAGTSDRTWWMYSMRADDGVHSQLVADSRAADDVGSVVSVYAKGESFFTLSSCGDLYSHRVTGAALEKLAVHRIADDNADLGAVESAIYSRDLRAAARGIMVFVESLNSEVKGSSGDTVADHPVMHYADTIASLCGLFKAKPNIESSAWSVAQFEGSEEGGAKAAFSSDLSVLGYGLPPGYPLEASALSDSAVWRALESLHMANMRVKLARIVQASDSDESQVDDEGTPLWKAAAERHKQIVQYLKMDPVMFDPLLLRRIVKIILPHDCIAGLTLGLDICEAYLELRPRVSCSALDSLVHVLLFPTIFDTESNNTKGDGAASQQTVTGSPGEMAARPVVVPDVPLVRKRIGECLEVCPDVVVEMIRLEIKVQQAVIRGGDQSQVAEGIVAAVRKHAARVGKVIDRTRQQPATRHMPSVQIHPVYPTTTTLSASAVRLYLNSLVPMRAYDEYLVNSQWWRMGMPQQMRSVAQQQNIGAVVGYDAGWMSSYPLATVINRQTATLVVPRFRRQIDVVLETVNKEPLGLEPRLYRDTLAKIARVLVLTRRDQELTTTVYQDNGPPSVVTTRIPHTLLSEAFEVISKAFLMVLEALVRHAKRSDVDRGSVEAAPLKDALIEILATEKRRASNTAAAMYGAGDQAVENLNTRVEIMAIAKYVRQLERYINSVAGASREQ